MVPYRVTSDYIELQVTILRYIPEKTTSTPEP